MFAAAVALRGDRAYAWVVTLTGVFGVVAPREAYREFAARFLYEGSKDVRWAERSTPILEAIGTAYALAALREFRRRRRQRSEPSGRIRPDDGPF